MKAISVTDQGHRENNEDRSLVKHFEDGSLLLAIADGMGGHAAGERAAQIATDVVSSLSPRADNPCGQLSDLIQEANRSINEEASNDLSRRGMGTTLTVVFIQSGLAHWAHVGDTRLYLFRNGALAAITSDHTIPGLLLKKGEITKEEARTHPVRNMLMRCIGCDRFEADAGSFEVRVGDLLLLSTDGMHDSLPEERIAAILDSDASLSEKLKMLIDTALKAGSKDNITVVGAQL